MKKNELFERLTCRDKAKRWRNISLVLILVILFFGMKLFTGDGNINNNYIARVYINGVIENNNYRDDRLEKIIDDKSIKAVIFHIDSPGGAIVTSEQIFNKMKRISEKKPIVVVMGNIAASGGYLVSLASDYILAGNGTITGSIGVLMQTFEVLDLIKRMGINPLIYKSSELKANPSLFEKPTEEANQVLNETIKDSHRFFMELIVKRRKMNIKEVEKIADGRIFTGRQALKRRLIDAIGYESDALIYLKAEKGIDTDELRVKDYELEEIIDTFGFKRFFYFISSLKSKKKGGIMAIYEGK
ncbi:signal peptide peptidase SppA [Pseudomonadota bacterium]